MFQTRHSHSPPILLAHTPVHINEHLTTQELQEVFLRSCHLDVKLDGTITRRGLANCKITLGWDIQIKQVSDNINVIPIQIFSNFLYALTRLY